MGVPLLTREQRSRQPPDPRLSIWRDIDLQLALHEDMLREDPSLRDRVQVVVNQLQESADNAALAIPASITAAFERLRTALSA